MLCNCTVWVQGVEFGFYISCLRKYWLVQHHHKATLRPYSNLRTHWYFKSARAISSLSVNDLLQNLLALKCERILFLIHNPPPGLKINNRLCILKCEQGLGELITHAGLKYGCVLKCEQGWFRTWSRYASGYKTLVTLPSLPYRNKSVYRDLSICLCIIVVLC